MQRRLFSFILAALLLSAFIPSQEQTTYVYASRFSRNTFTDVKADSWYYGGVKSAYDNGLMDGVGNGYFSPNNSFTLAQAITVAARMYASNKNETIDTAGAASWFRPYFDYAVKNQLLNDSIINRTDISTTNATRSETAFILYNVLKSKEQSPQVINSSILPDLYSISYEYRDAVQNMYKAGIITGMPDGSFNGCAYITRAQISTIIYRMIDKQERIPYDENYNYEMAGQAGNTFMYDGNIAYDDDYTYFSVDAGYGTGKSNIIRRNNKTGVKEALYIGNGPIYNLRLNDQKLYFIENKEGVYDDTDWGGTTTLTEYSCLICYDIGTKSAECLLKSDNYLEIHYFELYGDAIYLDVVGFSGEFDSVIVKVSDGKMERLVRFNHPYLSDRAIYLYNNKLYYTAQSAIGDYNLAEISLYSFDLSTKENKLLIQYDFGDYIITNGILYIQPYTQDTGIIYKYNVVTGNDYIKERKTIFYSNNPDLSHLAVSIVEGNVYIGYEKATSIYKVLGDGSLAAVCNVVANPVNFVVTGSGEFMYVNFWEPNRAQYYTSQYPYYNGLRDYLSLTDKDYQSAVKSVMDER